MLKTFWREFLPEIQECHPEQPQEVMLVTSSRTIYILRFGRDRLKKFSENKKKSEKEGKELRGERAEELPTFQTWQICMCIVLYIT